MLTGRRRYACPLQPPRVAGRCQRRSAPRLCRCQARRRPGEGRYARFADRWRAGYAPAMDKVRKGELPWTKLDVLHRMILDTLLPEFGLTNLTEEEKDHWNRVWHRLNPWPDSVAGLTRLKKKFIIAPCSNG